MGCHGPTDLTGASGGLRGLAPSCDIRADGEFVALGVAPSSTAAGGRPSRPPGGPPGGGHGVVPCAAGGSAPRGGGPGLRGGGGGGTRTSLGLCRANPFAVLGGPPPPAMSTKSRPAHERATPTP